MHLRQYYRYDMEKQLLPWLTLKSVPGIGNLLFKRLIDRFQSPESVLEASYEDLVQVDGITPRLVSGIMGHRTPDHVRTEIDLIQEKGYRIITLTDERYPPLLREIYDPPPFLYVHGDLEIFFQYISVVGARRATRYGIAAAKSLCEDLARYQLTVVSGMARGIDTAAHQGALSGRGKTVAVLGSGLERVYPAENISLFHQISEHGAVVSEFPLLTEPEAYNFPVRNRIISGMSLGTVVIEAARKSGSLITARLASEQNREVFAVPGSIHSMKSSGTHSLIKQGAKLVETSRDIIEELAYRIDVPFDIAEAPANARMNRPSALSSEETIVIQCLEVYPVHIDQLIRETSLAPGKLHSVLLQLELKDLVRKTEGNYFSLTHQGTGNSGLSAED